MAVKFNSSGGGSVLLDAPSTASNLTVTLPSASGTLATTDGGNTTFTSITDSGNLTFTGTGNRITGDFSNATNANRVMFQTTTANSSTSVQAIPNGTSNNAGFIALNSSSDPSNASFGSIGISSTDARIQSSITGTGTYLPMTFYTGGSERMRIDSSGNVGIGTSSPGVKLDVTGAIRASTNLNVSAGSVGQAALDMNCTANTTLGGSVIYLRSGSNGTGYPVSGSNMGVILFSDTSYSGGASIIGQASENHSAAALGTNLIFNTTPTGSTTIAERMRIDSSGNLLVGTTETGADATSTGVCALSGGILVVRRSNGTPAYFNRQSGNGNVISFYRDTNNPGNISCTTTATTYGTSSDYRLKENVQPMQNALDVVAQLNPVTYTWKADGSDGQGFIAHELQAVVPDCVTGEKDAVDEDGNPVYQGIDTSFLVATLTKAIQELKAEIDALKGAK